MYTLLVTGDTPGASTYFNPLVQQSIIPCTSGTRPTPSHDGMTVYETDTDLHATWNGSAWTYPYSPAYTDWSASVVFYSNTVSATAIAGGSVAIDLARYQKVNKRVHYYGSATINTTTGGGFGFNLPFSTSTRQFCMGQVYVQGTMTTPTDWDQYGNAFIPAISAPFNRVVATAYTNGSRNINTSGNIVCWNITYESV